MDCLSAKYGYLIFICLTCAVWTSIRRMILLFQFVESPQLSIELSNWGRLEIETVG